MPGSRAEFARSGEVTTNRGDGSGASPMGSRQGNCIGRARQIRSRSVRRIDRRTPTNTVAGSAACHHRRSGRTVLGQDRFFGEGRRPRRTHAQNSLSDRSATQLHIPWERPSSTGQQYCSTDCAGPVRTHPPAAGTTILIAMGSVIRSTERVRNLPRRRRLLQMTAGTERSGIPRAVRRPGMVSDLTRDQRSRPRSPVRGSGR